MKNLYVLFIVCMLGVFSFTGCKEYTSLNNASKISQLYGNPFLYNLSKSILKNTSKFLLTKGLKSNAGKVNLLTPLSSIITSPEHVDEYKEMLCTVYKIPVAKLAKKYNSLSSVKDLLSFVATNGQKFNFYSN